MRGKLTKATFLTVSLMMVLLIFTASFVVSINNAAATGCSYDLKLYVESGDPSVLAGVSFNLWSSGFYGFYPGFFSDGGRVVMLTRDIVSFDEAGKPSATCYALSYDDFAPLYNSFVHKEYYNSIIKDKDEYYYGELLNIVPLDIDGLSLIVEADYTTWTYNPNLLKMDLHITKEDELIFSGYIIFIRFRNGIQPVVLDFYSTRV